MVTLGAGDFTYQVSGEDWGNIPEDWTYKEATAVAVDAADNVYVFNRGPIRWLFSTLMAMCFGHGGMAYSLIHTA